MTFGTGRRQRMIQPTRNWTTTTNTTSPALALIMIDEVVLLIARVSANGSFASRIWKR